VRRALLLWQIASLIRFLAWDRLYWAAMEPETYGVWAADICTCAAQLQPHRRIEGVCPGSAR